MHILRRCILCIPGLFLRAAFFLFFFFFACVGLCKRAFCSIKNTNVPFVTSLASFILLICSSAACVRNVHSGFDDHVHSCDVYEPFTQTIVVRGECRVPRSGWCGVWERRGFAHLAHAVCVNSTRAAAKGAPSTRQTHPEEKMLSTNAQVHSKELEMSLACASRNKWPDREKKIFFTSFKGKTFLLWTEKKKSC